MRIFFDIKLFARNFGLLTISAIIFLLSSSTIWSDTDLPFLDSHSIKSEFPAGFRIMATAISNKSDIDSIAIRLRIGQQIRGAYDYLETDVQKGKQVTGELFWRTDTGSRYIPPGTIITYNFEIETVSGDRVETEQQSFIYFDARFVDDKGISRWEEVSDLNVTVAYKGPVKKRAEDVLRVINETLEKMRPVMGDAALEDPIRVTMYNNRKEMLEALPPKSPSISRELITEGQAFIEFGTLLVLGGGRLALGTASHEVMHIIVHRAGDSIFRRVPAWLDEGLAEYANVDPGFAYAIALEFAIETDRLLPHVYMPAMPGNSEDVIIFYGQSQSIVQFMIDMYGTEMMRKLMQEFKKGTNIDQSLINVYGFDRASLDNAWRAAIGAKPLERGRSSIARPTPVPQNVPLMYSLTPQAKSELISSKTSNVTEMDKDSAKETTTVTINDAKTETASSSELPTPNGQSGSCSAQLGSGADLGMVGLLVGIVLLNTRKRKR